MESYVFPFYFCLLLSWKIALNEASTTGDYCPTWRDHCGVCQGNGQSCCNYCDDNNYCTIEQCDVISGNCIHIPWICNDNNACTIDTCSPSIGCMFQAIICDDNDECTNDFCNPVLGCVFEQICTTTGPEQEATTGEEHPLPTTGEPPLLTTGELPEVTTGMGTTGLPYNPIQACPSGYINGYPSCFYAAGGCSFQVPTTNATINPPFLLSSSINQLDSIRLTAVQRITRDRTMIRINLNSSNPACNYPGSNWSKSVNQMTCHDEYVSAIPTPTALSSCGFVKDESNPDYLYYDGRATATWEDEISLDPVRGLNITRSSTGVLNFRIGFPKRVTIATSNAIFGSARIVSAIINQVYDGNSGLLEIKLFTSTQSPYRLDNLVVTQSAVGVVVTTSLFSNCPSHTQHCDQIFSIVMARNGTCTYDGTFRFNVNVTCSNCSSTSEVTSIQFSIQSGDVCGRVDDVTLVTPYIQSYGGFSNGIFQNIRSSFGMNDRVFLQLSVSSSGPRIQLSRIASVTVSNANGQPVSIISNDSPLVNGSYALLISSTATQRNHVISYVYQESWFGSVSTSVISTVSVVIDLTYSNGNKRSVVIRSSPDSYGNQLSTSTSLDIVGNHRDAVSSSSRAYVSGMMFIIVSFIYCIM